MAQHDYNIANQSGADFRADLNNALLAIATVNSGATEPSTTFAHQLWVDTSSSVLKIRNAADNAWITTGVSITASNTFTGDLTGNVVGNVTGNLVGNVTGDLTGKADSADILSTARTISLSGDVVGSVSFDGSANVDIDTVVQINSITLGTDTTGDYVESMSGGTGVTVTGGTGEGSTPSIAIGQAVATTDDVTFNTITATDQFIGDIRGAVRFNAKADGALSKGDVVYISGVSGDVATVGQAKADDSSKMPAFGFAAEDANDNAAVEVVTFGTLAGLDTSEVSEGQVLYVSTIAGEYTTTKPTGESALLQNIGKVQRSHATEGSIKVGGAGRSNATPNLNDGNIFIGNASNQAVTTTLDTSIVVENTNLYYTTARANTDFDTRLATKDTGDLTEGSNLYYTTARVNSDFDTRLATKDTGDLTEGVNLYYTDARVNSAFDTRLATKDTDDLTEGTTNLYYTSARANTDFDTRLATKSTTDLAEGTNLYYTSARFDSAFTSKDTDDLSEGTTNLYYTTARFDSAFGNKTTADLTENTNLYYTDTRANSAIDARVTKAFVDALGIQASSVDANSVTLGTDTTGNYVATVTGTANKITVTGSGSESANITLSLPDDVQIADSLTVAGNLTVNGTLTSLDTTNLDIEDNLFQLNAGLTGSPVNDSGMLINRGTSDNGIFMWDESVDKFTLGLTTADGSATGNITLNSLGTLVANLEGDVTGAVTGTVSSLSNHDTGDLAEGTNLYYTQARFDSALAAKSTSDLSEGTNLYYTDARFDTRLATKDTDDVSEGTTNLYYTTARFDSAFSGKSTSDLSEGTNLYYTSARANSDFDTRLATKDTGDLAEGSNLYYTDARADARVNLQTGTNLDLSSKSTSDLAEGSNLYYTDARVQAVSINSVVEDTTPQLGGNLDLNSSDITGTGDINITGTIQSSGNITGTLATASQPNITSVGTLTGLDVNGNVEIGSIETTTNYPLIVKSGTNDHAIAIEEASGGETWQLGVNVNGDLGFYNSGATTSSVSFIDAAGQVLIGEDTGDAFNADAMLRLQRAGDRVFQSFKVDADQEASIFFGDVDDDIECGIVYQAANQNLILRTGNNNDAITIDNNQNVGIGTSSLNADLHIGSANAVGDATNPAFQIGGSPSGNTYRLGLYTSAEGGVIENKNGDDGLQFRVKTAGEAMRIDGATGNVGIGTSSPSELLSLSSTNPRISLNDSDSAGTTSTGLIEFDATDGRSGYMGMVSGQLTLFADTTSDQIIKFGNGSGEVARFDASGNLLVGKTSTSTTSVGSQMRPDGFISGFRASDAPALFARGTDDGDVVVFRKNSSTIGRIGTAGGDVFIGGDTHLRFTTSDVRPCDSNGDNQDNFTDLGDSVARFDDIYATNGTIQTSDRNEKQDIEALTDAETRVAVAAKGLLRKFRWQSAVEEKGDEARIHFGIIAQDLQDAFTAEGLDASDYAMFISSTWWEAEEVIPAIEEELDEDGNVVTEAQEEKIVINTYDSKEEAPEDAIEKTRLGVRYSELLAFIIASL